MGAVQHRPQQAEIEQMQQLDELAQLHQAGVLIGDEFTAAKAKLLA